MADADAVRQALGVAQVNLIGGSYGTRAALVYMRRHGDHVRAVVLDSVAPTDMRLPLYTSRDAQRALDKLIADCDADARCHAAYPDFGDRVRALMQRVTASPVHTRLVHPRTGVGEDVEIGPRFVASVIFGALYQPITASILPTLLDRAEHNDFQGLLALAAAGSTNGDGDVSVGMQLSVLCAEDAPRVTDADLKRETASTVFGANLMAGEIDACRFWPRGHVDPSYYQPVVSDIPTLVLSGDLDPITPPTWGQEVASHLRHAKHVEVPASGHGVIGTACGWSLVQTFIDRGSVDGLDTSCVKDSHRPPFFLTPSGPDPTAASRAPAS
jgi:pimeloyl-ACP methyl ester carboxylesterase